MTKIEIINNRCVNDPLYTSVKKFIEERKAYILENGTEDEKLLVIDRYENLNNRSFLIETPNKIKKYFLGCFSTRDTGFFHKDAPLPEVTLNEVLLDFMDKVAQDVTQDVLMGYMDDISYPVHLTRENGRTCIIVEEENFNEEYIYKIVLKSLYFNKVEIIKSDFDEKTLESGVIKIEHPLIKDNEIGIYVVEDLNKYFAFPRMKLITSDMYAGEGFRFILRFVNQKEPITGIRINTKDIDGSKIKFDSFSDKEAFPEIINIDGDFALAIDGMIEEQGLADVAFDYQIKTATGYGETIDVITKFDIQKNRNVLIAPQEQYHFDLPYSFLYTFKTNDSIVNNNPNPVARVVNGKDIYKTNTKHVGNGYFQLDPVTVKLNKNNNDVCIEHRETIINNNPVSRLTPKVNKIFGVGYFIEFLPKPDSYLDVTVNLKDVEDWNIKEGISEKKTLELVMEGNITPNKVDFIDVPDGFVIKQIDINNYEIESFLILNEIPEKDKLEFFQFRIRIEGRTDTGIKSIIQVPLKQYPYKTTPKSDRYIINQIETTTERLVEGKIYFNVIDTLYDEQTGIYPNRPELILNGMNFKYLSPNGNDINISKSLLWDMVIGKWYLDVHYQEYGKHTLVYDTWCRHSEELFDYVKPPHPLQLTLTEEDTVAPKQTNRIRYDLKYKDPIKTLVINGSLLTNIPLRLTTKDGLEVTVYALQGIDNSISRIAFDFNVLSKEDVNLNFEISKVNDFVFDETREVSSVFKVVGEEPEVKDLINEYNYDKPIKFVKELINFPEGINYANLDIFSSLSYTYESETEDLTDYSYIHEDNNQFISPEMRIALGNEIEEAVKYLDEKLTVSYRNYGRNDQSLPMNLEIFIDPIKVGEFKQILEPTLELSWSDNDSNVLELDLLDETNLTQVLKFNLDIQNKREGVEYNVIWDLSEFKTFKVENSLIPKLNEDGTYELKYDTSDTRKNAFILSDEFKYNNPDEMTIDCWIIFGEDNKKIVANTLTLKYKEVRSARTRFRAHNPQVINETKDKVKCRFLYEDALIAKDGHGIDIDTLSESHKVYPITSFNVSKLDKDPDGFYFTANIADRYTNTIDVKIIHTNGPANRESNKISFPNPNAGNGIDVGSYTFKAIQPGEGKNLSTERLINVNFKPGQEAPWKVVVTSKNENVPVEYEWNLFNSTLLIKEHEAFPAENTTCSFNGTVTFYGKDNVWERTIELSYEDSLPFTASILDPHFKGPELLEFSRELILNQETNINNLSISYVFPDEDNVVGLKNLEIYTAYNKFFIKGSTYIPIDKLGDIKPFDLWFYIEDTEHGRSNLIKTTVTMTPMENRFEIRNTSLNPALTIGNDVEIKFFIYDKVTASTLGNSQIGSVLKADIVGDGVVAGDVSIKNGAIWHSYLDIKELSWITITIDIHGIVAVDRYNNLPDVINAKIKDGYVGVTEFYRISGKAYVIPLIVDDVNYKGIDPNKPVTVILNKMSPSNKPVKLTLTPRTIIPAFNTVLIDIPFTNDLAYTKDKTVSFKIIFKDLEDKSKMFNVSATEIGYEYIINNSTLDRTFNLMEIKDNDVIELDLNLASYTNKDNFSPYYITNSLMMDKKLVVWEANGMANGHEFINWGDSNVTSVKMVDGKPRQTVKLPTSAFPWPPKRSHTFTLYHILRTDDGSDKTRKGIGVSLTRNFDITGAGNGKNELIDIKQHYADMEIIGVTNGVEITVDFDIEATVQTTAFLLGEARVEECPGMKVDISVPLENDKPKTHCKVSENDEIYSKLITHVPGTNMLEVKSYERLGDNRIRIKGVNKIRILKHEVTYWPDELIIKLALYIGVTSDVNVSPYIHSNELDKWYYGDIKVINPYALAGRAEAGDLTFDRNKKIKGQ